MLDEKKELQLCGENAEGSLQNNSRNVPKCFAAVLVMAVMVVHPANAKWQFQQIQKCTFNSTIAPKYFAEFSIDDGDDSGDGDDYGRGVMMIVVDWWSLVLCFSLSLSLCGMCSLWRGQDALHAQRTNFMQYRSI